MHPSRDPPVALLFGCRGPAHSPRAAAVRQTASPSLGANVYEDHLTRAIGRKLGRELEGALVREVRPGSPAEAAGLVPARRGPLGAFVLGDLITGVGGARVRQVEDLVTAVLECKPGETITIDVARRGDPSRPARLRATLTSREAMRQRKRRDTRSWTRDSKP